MPSRRAVIEEALSDILQLVPDEALHVSEGETSIEIFINWTKMPDAGMEAGEPGA